MHGKPVLFLLLAVVIALGSPLASAQDHLNVSCVTQFDHNWDGPLYDLTVDGGYAYLSCLWDGLKIMHFGDARHVPLEVGRYQTAGWALAVCKAGNYLYLGDTGHGLRILDVTNPEQPEQVGSLPLTYWQILRIRVVDNYVYVAGDDDAMAEGVFIADVSNPAAPQVVWETPLPCIASDLQIVGHTLYAACHFPGLRVWDVTNPAAPVLQGSYSNPNGEWVQGVAVANGYAYLACGWDGLEIVDLGTMQRASITPAVAYAYGVQYTNGVVYVNYGDPECPLAIVDVSDPQAPQILGEYAPPEDLTNFQVVGETAWVADGYHGLRIVDVATPTTPVEVDHVNRYGHDLDVIPAGNRLYIREDYKLQIVDVTAPAEPHELGYFEIPGLRSDVDCQDVAAAGDFVYAVGGYDDLLSIVDVSNPSAPVRRGGLETEHAGYSIALLGDYAYVRTDSDLRVVDISNPDAPQQVAVLSHWSWHVLLGSYGRFLFLKDDENNLVVLTAANPLQPTPYASYAMGEWFWEMAAAEGRVAFATQRHVVVFDTSNFTRPLVRIRLLENSPSLCAITGIALQDDRVFASSDTLGLVIYDISEPDDPQCTGYFRTPGTGHRVAVQGIHAYVADGSNLGIYDISGAALDAGTASPALPGEVALLANYPNPFNASTTIPFELPRAGRVTLRVYDLLGRAVATLADANLAAGPHTVCWDGTDATGSGVASGRYFVRLNVNETVLTVPIVLLK